MKLTVVSCPATTEERDHARELRFVERVAALLDGDERADQILAALPAPLFEERAQIVDELLHQLAEACDVVRRERRCHDRVRPRAEAVAVGGGHAEELGDHGDRERKREFLDETHLAARLDPVDQLVGDLLDAWAQPLDHPRRERLRDEPAQATVVVAVLVQHVVARDEPERSLAVDPGLAEDGIALAHLRERRVRVGSEAVAVEVVLQLDGHPAAMLQEA